MVKTIHIVLEDAEYEKLVKVKDETGKSWHDFVMSFASSDSG